MALSDDQKKTPAEVLAGVREGEELVLANCPCCNELLAVYIARDKGCTVEKSKPED